MDGIKSFIFGSKMREAIARRAPPQHLKDEVGPLPQQHVVTYDAFGQPRPKSARHGLYHVLDPNPAVNQSAPAASEIENVAALRATWLDSRQQQNTSSCSKARSKALARNSANHAKIIAAADAITSDRVIVLETIVKIAQNAHKDAKYRSVKSSSKTLQEKVLRLGGGPLLAAVGFEEHGERWELSSEASAEHLQTLSSLLDAAQKLKASAEAPNLDRSCSPISDVTPISDLDLSVLDHLRREPQS